MIQKESEKAKEVIKQIEVNKKTGVKKLVSNEEADIQRCFVSKDMITEFAEVKIKEVESVSRQEFE